jgi:hydrogenase expression/formation protein HypE
MAIPPTGEGRSREERRAGPPPAGALVTMAHGAGGRATRDLVDAVFVEAFRNPWLDKLEDQATVAFAGRRLAITTDAFVVQPLFFPGGDLGSLAVHGTVNDLATAGARPLWLAAAFILEEGLPLADLRRIAGSMAAAAKACGAPVVTGDTKVVQRGRGDGLVAAVTGLGAVERDVDLSIHHARPGDRVVLSGPIGDHGVAVMLARGHLKLEAEIPSDSAPLWELVNGVLAACPAVRCFRDPTRGGAATVLNEIARASRVGIRIEEAAVPVRAEVRAACELLGIDPLYVANEGKMIAVAPAEGAEAVVAAMRRHPHGRDAAVIGRVEADPAGVVLLEPPFGGARLLDVLTGDPLPRIC